MVDGDVRFVGVKSFVVELVGVKGFVVECIDVQEELERYDLIGERVGVLGRVVVVRVVVLWLEVEEIEGVVILLGKVVVVTLSVKGEVSRVETEEVEVYTVPTQAATNSSYYYHDHTVANSGIADEREMEV